MDKEKFKKLVRLANNNPNDNEANLAARMACRMIAEDNFAGLLSAPQPTKTPDNSPYNNKYYNPYGGTGPSWSGFGGDYQRKAYDYAYQKSTYEDFWSAYDRAKKKEKPPDPRIEYKCHRCGCNAWALRNDARYNIQLCRMCYDMELSVYWDTFRNMYICSSCKHNMLRPIYETIIAKTGRCPKCRVKWKPV